MASRSAGQTLRVGALLAAVLALVALVAPLFINVNRFKGRVTESMSKAFGRTVTCDSIALRLLPQPGFNLANVNIADDPSYNLEPILHADEVTAYLGAASLWSGRMEIARVNLSYPSLNLVERDDGSWNFESVLWKAARTQTAPTAALPSPARTRFPYIEAAYGRINFKYGLEKSFFSFTDANFSLWSPAENQWRVRLQARPVRTDMPVSDTGLVKAEATLQRAEMLRDAPIKANVTWEHVQLGNLTRLIQGEDRGWRGALDTSTQFSGTPAALHFTSAAKLRDFRRFDIAGADEVNLSAACEGDLNLSTGLLEGTECSLPLDGGRLSVHGNVRGFHSPLYEISITADNLGANALFNLARHAKRNMPADLKATGTLTGSFNVSRTTQSPSVWTGSLELNELNVRSAVLEKDLAIDKVVVTAETDVVARSGRRLRPVKGSKTPETLLVQKFDLPLGGPNPMEVDGLLDPEGFALHLKGEGALQRLQQFARAFGIEAPKFSLSGPAAVDFFISSQWDSLNAPEVGGTAQLKDVRAEVPGVGAPVEIATAQVEFAGDRLTLHNASVTVDEISLVGSASFPRACSSDSPCEVGFDLSGDEFNPARWNELLNPRAQKQKRPWYFFGGSRAGTLPSNLQATGHISARRLTLDVSSPSVNGGPMAAAPLSGSSFEASISYADGVLELRNSRADLFGGIVAGDWRVDFTGSKPVCESTGIGTRLQAERLAQLLKGVLGSGAVDLHYKLKMSGWDAGSLGASATGEGRFTWTGGALRISPDARSPLRVLFGEGKATLSAEGWSISDSHWKTPTGVYQLRGSISRDSALDLEFIERGGGSSRVSGTLAKPEQGAAATTRPAPAWRR